MNNGFIEKPNIPDPPNLFQCIIILNKYIFIWYIFVEARIKSGDCNMLVKYFITDLYPQIIIS